MKSTSLKSRQQHLLSKPQNIMFSYISAYTVCHSDSNSVLRDADKTVKAFNWDILWL